MKNHWGDGTGKPVSAIQEPSALSRGGSVCIGDRFIPAGKSLLLGSPALPKHSFSGLDYRFKAGPLIERVGGN